MIRKLRAAPVVVHAFALGVRHRLFPPTGRIDTALPPVAAGPSAHPPSVIAKAARLGTFWMPAGRSCLPRSLTLAHLLRRHGHEASVVIGVSPDGLGADDRFAHAWVECRQAGSDPRFVELARFEA